MFLCVCLCTNFSKTKSRTNLKQVPIGPGGTALGGRIPPKLEIAQHREKSGDPGSIPGFGDFLSDSRLFPWEKERDGKVIAGRGARGGHFCLRRGVRGVTNRNGYLS